MKGDSTNNCKANHKGEMKFGKCLSCGEFHSRNSCAFRYAKCFKCGRIGHIKSVCKTTVHFAPSEPKSCNLDPNYSDVPSARLSLSTISEVNVHIQKRLYTTFGSFHDFVLDAGKQSVIKPVFGPKDLLDVLTSIKHPQVRPTFRDYNSAMTATWGLINLPINVKNLSDLVCSRFTILFTETREGFMNRYISKILKLVLTTVMTLYV
ncbi:unnamed protein product [Schistosoma mattheei]|uniref:Uncharacterized protein n=1 Tax=Schistosoma mattheei TaxID=31246 RepID=A0A183NK82_9TREM|nr:unnamed protein product [Schistosoma mattheei]